MLTLRTAKPDDANQILDFIRALAEYEQLLHEVVATIDDVNQAINSQTVGIQIAEWNGQPAGYALYCFNFSTFMCRPGLYLEDLFVKPEFRGKGIGKALLTKLADIAVNENCTRMEWMVLDWNNPAIEFYKNLGAEPLSGWTKFRLTGDALIKLSK